MFSNNNMESLLLGALTYYGINQNQKENYKNDINYNSNIESQMNTIEAKQTEPEFFRQFDRLKFDNIGNPTPINQTYVTNKGINKKVEEDINQRNSIALTPLAMPMLAGPGSISLLINFYQEHHEWQELIISCLAMLFVSILIFLVLKSAHYLANILGAAGIVAISRIVGFLTIAIGIQYIISSVLSIIRGI